MEIQLLLVTLKRFCLTHGVIWCYSLLSGFWSIFGTDIKCLSSNIIGGGVAQLNKWWQLFKMNHALLFLYSVSFLILDTCFNRLWLLDNSAMDKKRDKKKKKHLKMLDLSPGNGNLFILKGLLNETRDGFRITKLIWIQVLIIAFIAKKINK